MPSKRNNHLTVQEIAIFGMLGALMYASKWLMEILPNIHLIGVFTIAITVVYRAKALYPLYIFVFLTGLFAGFETWRVSYLYTWTILWAITMVLPQRMPVALQPIVYAVVCSLHGFLYGVLYLPVQMIFFHLKPAGILSWLLVGIGFDITHGISNFVCGLLICPLILALRQAKKLSG